MNKMKMMVSSLAVLTLGTYVSEAKTIESKPNILFILIDDFGWKDVGFNGSTFYETPRMDQLAREWMRFDNCYTPSPMCSPTRTSILTGKNPARHGITQWLPGIDKPYTRRGEKPTVYCPKPQSPGIKDSEITLGETFQEAGYDTAFYGKWHMGTLKQTGGPKKHGYASQLAIIQANKCNMFYPFRNVNYFPDAQKGDNYTDKLTDGAIDFISKKRTAPFYLHLCHFAMHAPIATTPELKQKFDRKKELLGLTDTEAVLDDYSHKKTRLTQNSSEYAGELYNLDQNIGRLIDALKQTGQYDNTIIILTGDNGGRASMNKAHSTSVAPVRGGKTFLFDGGLRTVLLIHWPGKSKPAMASDIPVTSMDFYPTLLEMAGIPTLPEQHIDGVSLVPIFNGSPLPRDTFYWHFPHYQGEGSYPASAIRKGDFKLIKNYHHNDLLLFDLKNDPNETKNLVAKMPEKAQSMKKELEKYLEETKAYIPAKKR